MLRRFAQPHYCNKIHMLFGFDKTAFALRKMLIYVAVVIKMHWIFIATTGEQKLLCSILLTTLKLLCQLIMNHFHWWTLIIQWTLQSYDKLPPEYLGWNRGLTKSINVSIKFASSIHYDANVIKCGISIWIKNNKISSQFIYVLPKSNCKRQKWMKN